MVKDHVIEYFLNNIIGNKDKLKVRTGAFCTEVLGFTAPRGPIKTDNSTVAIPGSIWYAVSSLLFARNTAAPLAGCEKTKSVRVYSYRCAILTLI